MKNTHPAMTRLCFFNATRFWGGGEKWHFETAMHLASRGHRILFIVHPGGELHKRLSGQPIKAIPIAVTNLSFLNPLKFQKLLKLFRSEKIQTVVFNGSSDVKLGAPAARLAGVQAIVYRRGLAVPVKDSMLNRFLYGSLVTHFLTNSEATAQLLLRNLGPHITVKVRTIYNGVDVTHLSTPCPDGAKNSGGKKLIMGTAGRLEAEKGHKHLLAAAIRLKEAGTDFQLLIAGEGSLRKTLENQIWSLGLTQHVQLLGFVSDMQNFMRQIDIFVFPSLWEGFGYATAEAMAAGRPVVAFDVSSNREVIEHDVTGFLVPVLDIDAFTEKIILLAANPEMRMRMGRNGKARVCDMFHRTDQLRKLEYFLCKEVLDLQ